MASPQPDVRERLVEVDGVRLHLLEAGPEDGPLVVLLHGFPEFAYGWRHQILPLAQAGHRVVVPDQRGYSTSDKPRRVADYRMERLGQDVLGLIQALGRSRAALVGHDWGAAVAWWLASHHPERLERLAILNVPHPVVMRRHLFTNPRQIARSWYIFFFQLPWGPEWLMRRKDWSFAAWSLQGTSRPGTFGPEDLARYREAWSRPGAMRAMIHWYRAAIRGAWRPFGPARVPVETLLLWGVHDKALGREMVSPSLELCDQGRLVWFQDAGHWIQHEEPARVTELLLSFLSGGLAAVRA